MRRALLLVLLAGCSHRPLRSHRPPDHLDLRMERIPEIEEFEPILERRGQLIEALLSIDVLVEGDAGRDAAREAYRELLEKARPLVEAAVKTGGTHAAAVEVMGLMRSEGFVYDDRTRDWSPQYGSLTECLKARRGICLSFTLLTMALLDSCGLESWAACYPRHVLVRVRKADREIELESTNYGDPVTMRYSANLAERSAKEGYIYRRSLDRVAAGWLYLSERLWGWVLLRSKDAHSFRLLERTELIMEGSEESLSSQWALRHQLRSARSILSAEERAESLRTAVEEYERLIRWNPRSGLPYLLLSVCYENTGDQRSALLVLKRFMNAGPDVEVYIDRFVQARWWIKRREFDLEDFRMTPDEKKRADDFLEEHFPVSDRAARLEGELRKLFKSTER